MGWPKAGSGAKMMEKEKLMGRSCSCGDSVSNRTAIFIEPSPVLVQYILCISYMVERHLVAPLVVPCPFRSIRTQFDSSANIVFNECILWAIDVWPGRRVRQPPCLSMRLCAEQSTINEFDVPLQCLRGI